MAEKTGKKEATLDAVVPVKQARMAICFPSPHSLLCDKLIQELEANGVTLFVNKGRVAIAGYQILGKGWASNVFLAVMGDTLVAVKALRPGSRRPTLLHEAAMIRAVEGLGISPRLYKYSHLFIAMEYIDSEPFIDKIQAVGEKELRYILRRLIVKAHLLDILGISHNELARPHNQVIVENTSLEPYIIDYEAATISSTASNVSQLIGGILRISAIRRRITPSIDRLRRLLRSYKRAEAASTKTQVLRQIIDEIAPL